MRNKLKVINIIIEKDIIICYYKRDNEFRILEGRFMRKIILGIICVALIFALSISPFAATGISDAEKQILNTIDRGGIYSTDFYEYENALRNYFNRDYISASQTEADIICQLLNSLYKELSLESPSDQKVMNIVISICNQLKLKLVYDRSTGTADFVGRDHTVILGDVKIGGSGLSLTFDTNPIKETGSNKIIIYAFSGIVSAGLGCIVVLLLKKKGKLGLNGKSSF